MKRALLRSVILAAAVSAATPAFAEGNPERGGTVFNKCKACHAANEKVNILGPHLVGLFGRKAGTVPGFRYSKGMKKTSHVWDEQTLDGFLTNPKKFVKGTRMPFGGLKKQQDRHDLIAYLKTATEDDQQN